MVQRRLNNVKSSSGRGLFQTSLILFTALGFRSDPKAAQALTLAAIADDERDRAQNPLQT